MRALFASQSPPLALLLAWLILVISIFTPYTGHAAELFLPPPHSASNDIAFAGIQEKCVQVGEINFGPGKRWANCEATQGHWLAMIDFLDLYQVRYCLGKVADTCQAQAFIIFANRAYTPQAKAILIRIDEASMKIETPLIITSNNETLMSMSMQDVKGLMTKDYFLWDKDHWIPFNAQSWLKELPAQLPRDLNARQTAWLELETMSASVDLFRRQDADCCPSGGRAQIHFSVSNKELLLREVSIQKNNE